MHKSAGSAAVAWPPDLAHVQTSVQRLALAHPAVVPLLQISSTAACQVKEGRCVEGEAASSSRFQCSDATADHYVINQLRSDSSTKVTTGLTVLTSCA